MPHAAYDDLPSPPEPAGSPPPGGFVLVSTPLGNLGDISARALAALRAADLILCEDTRTTAQLCHAFGIHRPLAALHEHNETARVPALLQRLRAGQCLVLVSDAGTPLISDPGYALARAVIAAGLPISAVPGANAALLALTLSGLPPHPFLFLGFPPARQAARLARFAELRRIEQAGLKATLIWFEAPHRLAASLADLAASFGARDAAVARELTKRFEEIRRATLPELAAYYATTPARGEITLLIGPAADTPPASAAELDTVLVTALAHQSLRAAVAQASALTGWPRGKVYARALEIKKERAFNEIATTP